MSFVRDCLQHLSLLYSLYICVLRSTFIYALALPKGHVCAKVKVTPTISPLFVCDYMNLGYYQFS